MDSTPQISYRQHSANTLGITAKKKELHFTNNTATQLKMRSSIKIALHYQTRMKNLLMRLIIIWLMEVPHRFNKYCDKNDIFTKMETNFSEKFVIKKDFENLIVDNEYIK